jgi:hypothetical protein
LEKIKDVEVSEVEGLDNIERGNQGFGSSRTGIQEPKNQTHWKKIFERHINPPQQT